MPAVPTARSVIKAAIPPSVRRALRRQAAAVAGDHRLPLLDLGFLTGAPTEMSIEERLFLYSLVRGHRPQRVLEIGTSQGGSALIIATALEHNRSGRIVTVDPMPRIEIDRALFLGRMDVVAGYSPAAVEEAFEIAGGPFDLVLIDGIHVYDQVKQDIAACAAHLIDGGYLLFHDAFHLGVSQAIAEATAPGGRLVDCGYVCNTPRIIGDTLTHGGFRLARAGAPVVAADDLLRPVYAAAGRKPPSDPDLINHDLYYCRYVKPCLFCEKNGTVVI